jgi:hypothetical protein
MTCAVRGERHVRLSRDTDGGGPRALSPSTQTHDRDEGRECGHEHRQPTHEPPPPLGRAQPGRQHRWSLARRRPQHPVGPPTPTRDAGAEQLAELSCGDLRDDATRPLCPVSRNALSCRVEGGYARPTLPRVGHGLAAQRRAEIGSGEGRRTAKRFREGVLRQPAPAPHPRARTRGGQPTFADGRGHEARLRAELLCRRSSWGSATGRCPGRARRRWVRCSHGWCASAAWYGRAAQRAPPGLRADRALGAVTGRDSDPARPPPRRRRPRRHGRAGCPARGRP